VDCFGLVLGVGIAAGVLEPLGDAFEPWAAYGRVPRPDKMVAGLQAFMRPGPADGSWLPGDVAFVAWSDVDAPIHLGIMAEFQGRASMIHADGTPEVEKVVEVTWGGAWPRRCHGFWRYPGLA
jgi:hypothetical protein